MSMGILQAQKKEMAFGLWGKNTSITLTEIQLLHGFSETCEINLPTDLRFDTNSLLFSLCLICQSICRFVFLRQVFQVCFKLYVL